MTSEGGGVVSVLAVLSSAKRGRNGALKEDDFSLWDTKEIDTQTERQH